MMPLITNLVLGSRKACVPYLTFQFLINLNFDCISFISTPFNLRTYKEEVDATFPPPPPPPPPPLISSKRCSSIGSFTMMIQNTTSNIQNPFSFYSIYHTQWFKALAFAFPYHRNSCLTDFQVFWCIVSLERSIALK